MKKTKTMNTTMTMTEVDDVYSEAAHRIAHVVALLGQVAGRKDCELGRWLGKLEGIRIGLECRLTGQMPEVRCGDQDCGWDLCAVRFPDDDLNTPAVGDGTTLSA